MKFELWYLVIGALLVFIALVASWVKRLPLSTTMLYAGVGIALGPLGLKVATIDPLQHAEFLERLAELAVIVSLFTTGLKLRGHPLKSWRVPVRLAFVSMTFTVGMVALAGVVGLGLPLGAAVLLGAVLAPTDPVLASDVQLKGEKDRDPLRFNLTGEAGMNDGTAFPFVMLGLGWLGLHEIGAWGWRWWVVDVVWAVGGGLGIGTLLGVAVARIVIYLRHKHREGAGPDEFLALGLIGLSYGTAVWLECYGFLAVFAAGLAFRTVERAQAEQAHETQDADPKRLATEVLDVNEQFERVLEVGLVLVLGLMLVPGYLRVTDLWFVAVLLLVIRPLAVVAGVWGERVPRNQLLMTSWFGIRGIGSIYYLMHGIRFGLEPEIASRLVSVTLWVILVSVTFHGISATPLIGWYGKRQK